MVNTMRLYDVEADEIELENVQEWLIIEPTEIIAIQTDHCSNNY